MNDSRVLSCHHYKIIAVLRYAIAGYARIIKSRLGSRQGAARDKMENQSWLKTRTPHGAGHVVNLCFYRGIAFSTLLTGVK